MTQKRLNNVMLLHCHKNKTDSLDMSAITKEFVSVNDAMKNYFWEFVICTLYAYYFFAWIDGIIY